MSGNHLQIPASQWRVLRRTSTSSEIDKYFFLLQTGVPQIFNMLLSRLIKLFLFILCITCTKIKSVFIPTKTFAHSGNPALNKPRPSLYNVSRLAELHLERPAAVWPPDAFPGQKYSFSPALSLSPVIMPAHCIWHSQDGCTCCPRACNHGNRCGGRPHIYKPCYVWLDHLILQMKRINSNMDNMKS